MPKGKELGEEVTRSMETLRKLRDCLKSFLAIPLKNGLRRKGLLDADMIKSINMAREKVTALDNEVESIMDTIRGIKTDKNSRFASRRVIQKFIEREEEE